MLIVNENFTVFNDPYGDLVSWYQRSYGDLVNIGLVQTTECDECEELGTLTEVVADNTILTTNISAMQMVCTPFAMGLSYDMPSG